MKKSKPLKFYCKSCAIDFSFKKIYSHKCKLTFHERINNLQSVFRCKNCHNAFQTPEAVNGHESYCLDYK